MPGELSMQEIWRETKLERKAGARSHPAFVAHRKEFGSCPNDNGKAAEGGRKGRKENKSEDGKERRRKEEKEKRKRRKKRKEGKSREGERERERV